MKNFFWKIVLQGRKITYLTMIIRNIKRDIRLQQICLNNKDYKEVKTIGLELLAWLEELGL